MRPAPRLCRGKDQEESGEHDGFDPVDCGAEWNRPLRHPGPETAIIMNQIPQPMQKEPGGKERGRHQNAQHGELTEYNSDL